jgi:hypothetical protein
MVTAGEIDPTVRDAQPQVGCSSKGNDSSSLKRSPRQQQKQHTLEQRKPRSPRQQKRAALWSQKRNNLNLNAGPEAFLQLFLQALQSERRTAIRRLTAAEKKAQEACDRVEQIEQRLSEKNLGKITSSLCCTQEVQTDFSDTHPAPAPTSNPDKDQTPGLAGAVPAQQQQQQKKPNKTATKPNSTLTQKQQQRTQHSIADAVHAQHNSSAMQQSFITTGQTDAAAAAQTATSQTAAAQKPHIYIKMVSIPPNLECEQIVQARVPDGYLLAGEIVSFTVTPFDSKRGYAYFNLQDILLKHQEEQKSRAAQQLLDGWTRVHDSCNKQFLQECIVTWREFTDDMHMVRHYGLHPDTCLFPDERKSQILQFVDLMDQDLQTYDEMKMKRHASSNVWLQRMEVLHRELQEEPKQHHYLHDVFAARAQRLLEVRKHCLTITFRRDRNMPNRTHTTKVSRLLGDINVEFRISTSSSGFIDSKSDFKSFSCFKWTGNEDSVIGRILRSFQRSRWPTMPWILLNDSVWYIQSVTSWTYRPTCSTDIGAQFSLYLENLNPKLAPSATLIAHFSRMSYVFDITVSLCDKHAVPVRVYSKDITLTVESFLSGGEYRDPYHCALLEHICAEGVYDEDYVASSSDLGFSYMNFEVKRLAAVQAKQAYLSFRRT